VDELDDVTRARVREWQLRRIEIKDRMQAEPERTLELSRLLDAMDDEHAQIMAEAAQGKAQAAGVLPEPVASIQSALRPGADVVDLQLSVSANNLEDLRRLLEMAIYEAQVQIDCQLAAPAGESGRYPGSMAGTLGHYRFELGINAQATDAASPVRLPGTDNPHEQE
jgi:hypothetical protein